MVETSNPLEHDRDGTMLETPSKVRVMNLSSEDQENILNLNEASFSTPTKKGSILEVPSTVSARREWLNNFAKRSSNHFNAGIIKEGGHESHLFKTQPNTKANQDKAFNNDLRRSSLIPPMTETLKDSDSLPLPTKRNFTPRKKKIVHSGIEATDDGYASVATLSQWLANDPTSKKKKLTVRRGRNVSYKSRKFDRGQESAIAKENHIQRGSVSDKKNWLKNAFQNIDKEPVDELTSRLNTQYAKSEIGVYDPYAKRYAKSEIVSTRPSTMSVTAKKDWLKRAFKSAAEASDNEEEQQETRSMIITDDAASRLSVSDKKSWLQSAFKKSQQLHSHPHSCAATDIVHSRGVGRDEIAARAKQRFLQRSTRPRGTEKSPIKETSSTPAERHYDVDTAGTGEDREKAQVSKSESIGISASVVERIRSPIRQVEIDEDKTPLDFRAARDFLVQRTRQTHPNIMVRETNCIPRRMEGADSSSL